MQFREVAWAQQLYYQRLLHGAGAEVTERSLPNYPGTALREIIRQSGQPLNVEPLLLTLRRPANAAMRKRFAEAGGELVLITKVTSPEPVATDFKVAVHGQILDSPEGILYPNKHTTTTYETWLRVEMLDALRLMVEENLVRSLVPEMQVKLVHDMLALAADPKQHELVALYAFCVAYAAVKKLHAARPAALRGGAFAEATVAYLRRVLDEGARPPDSVFVDPFELLKALTTCVEALYVVGVLAAGTKGELALPAAGSGRVVDPAPAEPTPLGALQREHAAAELAGLGTAPLLRAAVERCWQLLRERDAFEHAPAPAPRADSDAGAEGAEGAEGEGVEEARMRKAAEDAAAAASVTFEENWLNFLKAVYDTELVPTYALTAVQLGCALLQLLAHEGVEDQLPAADVLRQMAAHKDPLAATTGAILLAASGEAAAAGGPAALPRVDGATAILGLPQHEDLELGAFAKLCFACNKPEGRETKLLRCGQCGVVYYCSPACQKADWKLGHKGVCAQLAESRAAIA